MRISDDGLELADKLAKKTRATRSEALRVLFAVGAEHPADVEKRLRQIVAEVDATRAARGLSPRPVRRDDTD